MDFDNAQWFSFGVLLGYFGLLIESRFRAWLRRRTMKALSGLQLQEHEEERMRLEDLRHRREIRAAGGHAPPRSVEAPDLPRPGRVR